MTRLLGAALVVVGATLAWNELRVQDCDHPAERALVAVLGGMMVALGLGIVAGAGS